MENDNKKPVVKMNKEYKMKVRKKQLFDRLNDTKNEYKKNGICDQYIKFGKMNVEDVIDKINDQNNEEMQRYNKLSKKLKKRGLKYDDKVQYYRDYIKKGGNIYDAIKDGEIEWFYLRKTDYSDLLKKYRNEELAQNKALQKYIVLNGRDEYVNKILKREMTVCIY
jgi:hypothetical protein